ncbi:hydroxyacid dehydrogenase [Mycobacterium sp. 21AC1]|uniref:NAD(P)-dependent oxidoreductase n=1 Tax=[Mycobacterium] appelbergii TaxID=2939269 RepID=UPI00293950B0|nr:NAD(P)-dependent oxidoreductase [Mycobacterium sp. 21AC1]MDV3127658.1 hydroxyacid dehydrogenase [Mycobacterium sp. 21AC1]
MTAVPLRVSIMPDAVSAYEQAVTGGGGVLVGTGDEPEVLIWSRHGAPDVLASTVTELQSIRWVQLPAAGVEDFFRSGAVKSREDVVWTSAKGAYAEPVAEHAHALVLALLRQLPERLRAKTWGQQAGTSLHRKRVLIVGGGGIGKELARLLTVYSTATTVIRRRPLPIPHVQRVLTMEHLHRELPDAEVVVLAAALTPETYGMFSEVEFALMNPRAVLVNVARGGLVVTDHLVDALESGRIAGAAVDVTDPEPLPNGHPLWSLDNAIVTPHTADTIEMIVPLLAKRIEENLIRFATGQQLVGTINRAEGY